MNIDLAKLKSFYKKTPPVLLKPLLYAPFSLFCGSHYRKMIALQYKFNEMSHVERLKYIDDLLVFNLNEAIKHVRFYKDFAKSNKISFVSSPEQLFDFPIVSKDQVSQDLSWFLDHRFLRNSYSVTTGGTTGKQTLFKMSNQMYAIEWAFINFFLSEEGIDINSKRLCLRGVEGNSNSSLLSFNYLYKELVLSPFQLNKKSYFENYRKIVDFKPLWIHGYPSSVSELARLVLELGLSIESVRFILLVSESITSDQLDIINKAFNAKVITFYGMSERVVFAPYNGDSFKPNPLYGHTEVVNSEIVGTGFWNKATRLIRYKTGDILDSPDCSKLLKFPYVDGRWGKDYLLGKEFQKITMTSLNTHSDVLNKVIKYQFYQNEVGVCDLRLEVSDDFDKEKDLLEVHNLFKAKVGGALDIFCVFVNDIPLTVRGKHRFIINDLLLDDK